VLRMGPRKDSYNQSACNSPVPFCNERESLTHHRTSPTTRESVLDSLSGSCSRLAVQLVLLALTSVRTYTDEDSHGPPQHSNQELGLSKP
jgi:hypothetical protein